jgi:hypothetical protein
MNIIISLLFAGLNVYFAYQAYQRRNWLWFTINTAVALFCAAPLLWLIR